MLNILPSVFFILFGANVEMATLSHGDLKMELTDLSYDIEDAYEAGITEDVYLLSQKSIDLLVELKRRNKLSSDHENVIVKIDGEIANKSLEDEDLSNLLRTVNSYSFHRAKSR